MSKKLCFLMCFVLVLALSGAAGAVALDVNNFSFEYDCDGNQILSVVKTTDAGGCPSSGGFMGWFRSGGGMIGAVLSCDSNLFDDPNSGAVCKTGGLYGCTHAHVHGWVQDADIYLYQVTDNTYGSSKRYTMTYDTIGEEYGGGWFRPSLFYPEDPCLPDVNHIECAYDRFYTSGERYINYGSEFWTLDRKLAFDVLPGAACIGKKIGIKFFNETSSSKQNYVHIDNVRLEEEWATNAYDPSPDDGAIDVVDTNLSWTPGAWVDKHKVYLSTSFVDVNTRAEDANKGLYDVNSYTPPGVLQLGTEYFWAVDEVNTSYVQGAGEPPAPPNGVWLGNVWSFTTISGDAYGFSPEDGTANVNPNVVLSWTKGKMTDCSRVYFSTIFGDVNDRLEDANQGCIGPDSFDPTPGSGSILDIGTPYYWAVDEVNDAVLGSPFKSDVMGFTVANYIVVDDMDSYADDVAIEAVWDTDHFNQNRAVLFLEEEPNLVRSNNSMMFTYMNYKIGPGYKGSEAVASTTDLDVSPDWNQQGVKALVLYFFGDPINGTDHGSGYVYPISVDQMYVAMEDGSANVGIVQYPDMNAVKEASWHEWNIDLQDFNDAGVVMSNVSKVYIGFGGQKVGQTIAGAGEGSARPDTVWFDDIGLYPPRCFPALSRPKGDFDGDCVVGYSDLGTIAHDWLESGETASPPDAGLLLAWYEFEEGTGQNVGNSGTLGSSADGMLGDTLGVDVNDPNWITSDPCAARERCLEFYGNSGHDHVLIPAGFGVTTNTATYTTWVKRDGDQQFLSFIFASQPSTGPLSGLTFGWELGTWANNNELGYSWRGDAWAYHSGLIVPDGLWTFIAVTIAPDEATLYMSDGTTLSSAAHIASQDIKLLDGINTIGGRTFRKSETKPWIMRYVNGRIDDARFYNYTLSRGEVLYLVDPTGYQPLEDFRAELNDDDKVDFADYVILANNWFKDVQWPFQ